MKFHSCHYCDSSVSELGSYVQISSKLWAHLGCYTNEIQTLGIKMGREAVIVEQRDAREAAVSLAASDAVRQYEAAPRCLKCGQKMLSERPQTLPAAFSSVLPATSQPGVCATCVRAEVTARDVARNTPTLRQLDVRIEETIQAKSRLDREDQKKEEPSTLIPGGRPIEID